MSEEEWRPVNGYIDLYEVSSLGNVRSIYYTYEHGRSRYGRTRRYKPVNLSHNTHSTSARLKKIVPGRSRGTNHVVGRLVLEAFVGPPPKYSAVVGRRNGDNFDDRLANLYWSTPAEVRYKQIEDAGGLATECIRGHAFIPANERFYPNTNSRVCNACYETTVFFKRAENKDLITGRDDLVFLKKSNEIYAELINEKDSDSE